MSEVQESLLEQATSTPYKALIFRAKSHMGTFRAMVTKPIRSVITLLWR